MTQCCYTPLMGRKQWEAWSVFNDTEIKWAHLQDSQRKKKGLIHKHRYDSAHLCVLVSGKQQDPKVLDLVVDLWCYGPFFNGDAPGFGLKGGGAPSTLAVTLPSWGPQAVFAQVWRLLRKLRQRFLLADLSARLGHPDSSLHSSAAKRERCFCDCMARATTLYSQV